MSRRVWIGVALGGLLLLAAPAQGVALAQPTRVSAPTAVLTGTVTISGSQSGYVPVTVAKDMKLGDPFAAKYRGVVTVTGGGDAAGFALVQDGLKGQVLLAGRSEAYAPFVKKFGVPVNSLNPDLQDGAEFTIPAGDYRLYLITGGQPTSVTIKFLGGSGTSRLAPTTKVESVVQQVGLTTPAPGPVGGVYSGGGAVSLTSPILQFSLSRLDTSAHTESVMRYCYFLGDKPAGPQPYGPACAAPSEDSPVVLDSAGGSSFLISDEGVGPQSFYGFNSSLTTSRTGEPVKADIAAGVSYTTAGVVTGGDYSQYWLSLDGVSAAALTKAAPAEPVQSAEPTPGAPKPGQPAPAVAGDQLPATGAPAALLLAPVLLLAGAWRNRASGDS